MTKDINEEEGSVKNGLNIEEWLKAERSISE